MKKGTLSAETPEYATKTAELVTKKAGGDAELEATLTQLMASPEADVAKQTLETYLGVYNILCWVAVGAGVVLMLAAPILKKWQHGVE